MLSPAKGINTYMSTKYKRKILSNCICTFTVNENREMYSVDV